MTKFSLFLFKKTTVFCLQSIFFTDLLASNQILVKDVYSGAQFWFNSMAKKYPQAHLDNVLFYVSDQHEAGTNAIGFPEDVLQEMHEVFDFIKPKKATQEMFEQFLEHEYWLMHEAHHVLRGDFKKGEIAFVAIRVGLACIALGLIAKSIGQGDVLVSDVVKSVAGTAGIITAMYAYARYQERHADNFANKHADVASLRAVAAELDVSNDLKNKEIPKICKWAISAVQDPAHPSLQSRENKIRYSLWLRFIGQ